mmetsp:Transcript_106426/g.129765  ORF Transcript_106426/g.129765 Transcript_106426/m.129765 type:complete len:238 (-) Transcript_106426:35-748(-)
MGNVANPDSWDSFFNSMNCVPEGTPHKPNINISRKRMQSNGKVTKKRKHKKISSKNKRINKYKSKSMVKLLPALDEQIHTTYVWQDNNVSMDDIEKEYNKNLLKFNSDIKDNCKNNYPSLHKQRKSVSLPTLYNNDLLPKNNELKLKKSVSMYNYNDTKNNGSLHTIYSSHSDDNISSDDELNKIEIMKYRQIMLKKQGKNSELITSSNKWNINAIDNECHKIRKQIDKLQLKIHKK